MPTRQNQIRFVEASSEAMRNSAVGTEVSTQAKAHPIRTGTLRSLTNSSPAQWAFPLFWKFLNACVIDVKAGIYRS